MKKYIYFVLGFFFVLDLSAQQADSTSFKNLSDSAAIAQQELEEMIRKDSTEAANRALLERDYFESSIDDIDIDEGDKDINGYPLGLGREEGVESFEILDSIATHNRFIFTGEDHRVEGLNTRLEARMMQYLHSKGYDYYLLEAGYATSWMVNQVIQKNNDTLRESLKNYFSPNFYQLFTELEKLNLGKDSRKPIEAVGLDIERNIPIALKMLRYLLPEKSTPDSLEMFTESLRILSSIHEAQGKDNYEAYDEYQDIFEFGTFNFEFSDIDDSYEYQEEKYFFFNSYKTVQELTKEFRRKEQEFKSFLRDNFSDFERVIKELENWQIWIKYEMDGMPQSWVYREQYMEGNFKSFFQDKPEAKGFGQFGRCHTTRITKAGDCGFAFFSSLNKRIITKMPELKNQVASIGIFYPGIEYGNDYTDNGNISELIEASPKGKATLYIDLPDYADSVLQEKFSAIIVAKSNTASSNVNYNADPFMDEEFRIGFIAGYQFQNINFNKFNAGTNFGIKSPVGFVEFGYAVHQNNGFWIENSLGFMTKSQSTFNSDSIPGNGQFASRNMTLRGWNYRYSLGGDLLSPRWIDLAPMAGFGYQHLVYEEELINGTQTSLGSNASTKFTNPSFYLDFRLNLNFNSRWITLSTYTGYLLDLSDSRWLLNRQKVNSNVRTSQNNWFYGATLGINFNNMY